MSGHNKWSKIKHKKGANDAKKGKIYSKILRELAVAIKTSGPDGGKTALVVAKARAARMPMEMVNRAISKAKDTANAESFEEVTYECYGPGGVAIVVDALTDNRNRTVSDIKHILGKYQGNLAAAGSTLWQFKSVSQLGFEGASTTEDKLMEALLDAGADDIDCSDPETFFVTGEPNKLAELKEAAEKAGLKPTLCQLTRIASNTVAVPAAQAASAMKLMEMLEDNDDVQAVYSNLEITDDLAAQAG